MFPVHFRPNFVDIRGPGAGLWKKQFQMQHLSLCIFLFYSTLLSAQQLQWHYDFRHAIDPAHNVKNFPALNFEYFKTNDSTAAFLLKMQTDFNGEKMNPGQLFLQITQNIRHWKPKVYLSLNYSGGLGVAPPAYGYYLTNAFAVGPAYPFQWKRAWWSVSLLYRYNTFQKASHDTQFNFYFGKGCFQYKLFITGSLVAWTENRNQGTDFTKGLSGKKFAFFGDPQIWWRFWRGASVGSRINLFYHVLRPENNVQIYPTVAFKKQF